MAEADSRPGDESGSPAQSSSVSLAVLVTLLCLVSGSLDAISFLELGEAFASVMTGNIVFMGVALGTTDGQLAKFCGIALLGYTLGSLAGSRLTHRWRTPGEDQIWPARVTKTLAVQFVLLGISGALWLKGGGEPGALLQAVLLGLVAAAMGLQSAAVRAVGVTVSTTYMTGALTALLEAFATRRRFSSTESSAASGIAALLAGAAMGSAALLLLREMALFVSAAPLAVVLLVRVLPRRVSVTVK